MTERSGLEIGYNLLNLAMQKKIMKKIVLLIAMLLLGAGMASAQKEIGAGYGNSTLLFVERSGGATVNYKTPYTGAYLTFTGQLAELYPDITLRSGVLLSYGTYKDSKELDKETYLTVPIDIRASTVMGKAKFYCGLGPRLSYGLSSTISASSGGASIDLYDSSSLDYARFDVMFGFDIGVFFNETIGINLGLDRGLVKRFKEGNVSGTRDWLSAGLVLQF